MCSPPKPRLSHPLRIREPPALAPGLLDVVPSGRLEWRWVVAPPCCEAEVADVGDLDRLEGGAVEERGDPQDDPARPFLRLLAALAGLSLSSSSRHTWIEARAVE